MEYAKTSWAPEDVQSLRPEWSIEQCEQFLQDNQRKIADRLIELGWEVITDFIEFNEKDINAISKAQN